MQLVRPSTFPVGSLRRHSGTLAQPTLIVRARQRESAVVEKLIDFRAGSALFRDKQGRLFVGSADGTSKPRRVDPASPAGVLPVLELDPEALPRDVVSEVPVEDVLALPLRWKGDDYWPGLAVEWIARTSVSPAIRDALADFAHSRLGSQRSRHAARRLLKESE